MRLIWGRRLEKKVGELIIVVSLLFSISLAQAGKSSDAEIAVSKSGIALEQEAIKKVEPVFPPIAKAARASGEVKVEVTIDKAGKVISARVLSGHPLLRDAALTAARQWEFKPTMVSGKPAKVSGILTFNFVLDDGRKSEAEADRNILAGVYLIQGHLDEVITNLRSAIKLNPNFAEARFGLGMAYSAIGDKQAALKEYRAIKKLDPQLAQQLLSNINQ